MALTIFLQYLPSRVIRSSFNDSDQSLVNILDTKDYRTALGLLLAGSSSAKRGAQKRLADALNCSSSYLSQVLSGNNHLTLDQAADAAQFFGLSDNETEYLLTMVGLERSGSRVLRQRLMRKLRELRAQPRESVGVRVDKDVYVNSTDYPFYFSSAWPQVILRALDCSSLQTRHALVERFRFDAALIESTIDQLLESGLISISGDGDLIPQPNLRWKRQDPLAASIYRSMLSMAMQHVDMKQSTSALAAGTLTLSAGQAARGHELFLELKQALIALSESDPAPPDDVHCFTYAFFRPN